MPSWNRARIKYQYSPVSDAIQPSIDSVTMNIYGKSESAVLQIFVSPSHLGLTSLSWNWIGMYKLIRILAIALTITCTSTLSFAKKLDMYECQNLLDAEKCTICKKQPSFLYTKWEFKINDRNQSVLRTVYYKDQSPKNDIFPNCTIFDENNWECNRTQIFSDRTIYSEFKMLNGIFSEGLYSSFTSKSSSGPSLCGK